MSINGAFRQISGAALSRVKANPIMVEEIIEFRAGTATAATDADALLCFLPADMQKALQQMPADMRADFLAYSNRTLAAEAATSPQVREHLRAARQRRTAANLSAADLGELLEIGKAWHGVHYLLCGDSANAGGPLREAVLGGSKIGPERSYGAARYLERGEVQKVSAALEDLSPEEFGQHFDAAALEANQTYPGGWLQETDAKRWLCDAYSALRSFYRAAAAGGFGVILYLA